MSYEQLNQKYYFDKNSSKQDITYQIDDIINKYKTQLAELKQKSTKRNNSYIYEPVQSKTIKNDISPNLSKEIQNDNIKLQSLLTEEKLKTSRLKAQVENYENELNKIKIDIQLLGVGSNGHIGFNEPGTDFDLGVHEVNLTENTIKDNARFFENDINKVPKKAITMGIKNILNAETIILIANGKNKANAIKNIMSGVVDKNIPASALNLHKGKVYVIVDKDAASLL